MPQWTPFEDQDPRPDQCEAAGMRRNAKPHLVKAALTECAVAEMDESGWKKFANNISEDAHAHVTTHDRFLRSRSFGDDDYEGHVLDFFHEHLGGGFENLEICVEALSLRDWLETNNPKRFADLYDGTIALPAEADLANLPNAQAIRENLVRLASNHNAADPAGTIGAAKELIESTAKVILTAENQTSQKNEDLPSLIKRTHVALDLHAKNASHSDPEVEKAVKQIRSGLQNIVLGVGDLRNTAGTGHGRSTPSPSGLADDAQLAAGAATLWINSVLAAYSEFTNARP